MRDLFKNVLADGSIETCSITRIVKNSTKQKPF